MDPRGEPALGSRDKEPAGGRKKLGWQCHASPARSTGSLLRLHPHPCLGDMGAAPSHHCVPLAMTSLSQASLSVNGG